VEVLLSESAAAEDRTLQKINEAIPLYERYLELARVAEIPISPSEDQEPLWEPPQVWPLFGASTDSTDPHLIRWS
jgi:hypothetical protein